MSRDSQKGKNRGKERKREREKKREGGRVQGWLSRRQNISLVPYDGAGSSGV